jgi:hypothetical protein
MNSSAARSTAAILVTRAQNSGRSPELSSRLRRAGSHALKPLRSKVGAANIHVDARESHGRQHDEPADQEQAERPGQRLILSIPLYSSARPMFLPSWSWLEGCAACGNARRERYHRPALQGACPAPRARKWSPFEGRWERSARRDRSAPRPDLKERRLHPDRCIFRLEFSPDEEVQRLFVPNEQQHGDKPAGSERQDHDHRPARDEG